MAEFGTTTQTSRDVPLLIDRQGYILGSAQDSGPRQKLTKKNPDAKSGTTRRQDIE